MSAEKQLHILMVDDEEVIHQTIGGYLKDLGHNVTHAYNGKQGLKLLKDDKYDLALLDIRMPEMDGISLMERMHKIYPEIPVVIITGHGTMEAAIQALRLGAADFLTKPVKLLELDAIVEKCKRLNQFSRDRRRLKETIRGIQSSREVYSGNRKYIGKSENSHRVREQILQAVEAKCDTILITGETGTGKEVAASEIHYQANNDDSPFIAVCCPALPETLLESELFGHVKGAYTGAGEERAGYFELADGGTLFLDDVSDLSHSAQASLLRVLETRKFRRIGGAEEISVNLRVITASNRPLEKLVEQKAFRSDLFYRLNVFSIHIEPLRERREDIMPLAEHFLSIYASAKNLHFRGFSGEAVEILENYDYPGNARELRNIIERAAILCRTELIRPYHLNLQKPVEKNPDETHPDKKSDNEKSRILNALHAAKWNRKKAAENLNIPYSTLRYKIKRYGID